MTYWAHSDNSGLAYDVPGSQWQKLADHLANVGVLSRRLAELASPTNPHFHELAAVCGLLHDFGKYSDEFQQMIRTGNGKCQHAIHGAVLARFGTQSSFIPPNLIHVAAAIAGHHAGIPDLTGGGKSLAEKTEKFRDQALALVERATADCSQLKELLTRPSLALLKFDLDQFDLFTRMLFSCLVDADRLDSAGRTFSQEAMNASKRLEKLLAYVERRSASCEDGVVKSSRQKVLSDCLKAAAFPECLLSLTVPTGGGKTLASMAFALKRAALYPDKYRRIIVVIPYLSIIEQNAEVYRNVFGCDAILEHHSGSFERLQRYSDQQFTLPSDVENFEESYEAPAVRNETENWDAPLIVTTSVRFFESLFSNRPSALRRVHNIARSVVILDEVQTLPRRLLAPLLTIIKELESNWGCSFAFCTATQPAFQKQPLSIPEVSSVRNRRSPRWKPGTIREIVQRPDELRKGLKRVHIDWRIHAPMPWTELVGQMFAEKQALAVVNVRDHASLLFDNLLLRAREMGTDESSCFHLSTRMCAAHRLEILDKIRQRLRGKLPCFVASTQLVEAGVDLDFPVVFRALGPLDSIFQAAGRADREGILTAALGRPAGKVMVFLPEDPKVPPNEYKEATEKTKSLVLESLKEKGNSGLQVDSVEVMDRYFERYYGEGADLGEGLQKYREKESNFKFATLADEFEMISSRTKDVFVPYGEGKRWIEELRDRKHLTRELRRKLQRYVVGLSPWEFQKAQDVLIKVEPAGKTGQSDSDIWISVEAAYSDTKGLKFELEAIDFIG